MEKRKKSIPRFKIKYPQDSKLFANFIFIALTTIFFLLIFFYDSSNKYYNEAILFYIIFSIVQVLAMIFGSYKDSNKFFNLSKIDVYTHFLGGLAIYFVALTIFNLDIFVNISIVLAFGIIYEFIEYGFERFIKMRNKKKKIKTSTETKRISENGLNIIQDLIMNVLGGFIGSILIIIGFNI